MKQKAVPPRAKSKSGSRTSAAWHKSSTNMALIGGSNRGALVADNTTDVTGAVI